MDYLWTPWRFHYMTERTRVDECIFCEKPSSGPSNDREHLILHRGRLNFVILNLYPYTTGHTMVVPYAHVPDLSATDTETLNEMMSLARQLQQALKACYKPEGYNVGLNIGRCAGAGVDQHLHLHVLPRWTGDSNFMTVVGETRIQPEDLTTTYEKLAPFFRA